MKVTPCRAIVRPRVYARDSTEPLWLYDAVAPHLRQGRGAIRIDGLPRAGKSTALAHLAAVLPPEPIYVDEPYPDVLGSAIRRGLVIYAAPRNTEPFSPTVFTLAPWDDDDVLEYLLAVHRDRCADVIARFRAARDRWTLGGNPELTRFVLDRMATNDFVPDVRTALRRELDVLIDPSRREQIETACLETLLQYGNVPSQTIEAVWHEEPAASPGATPLSTRENALRLLRHPVAYTLVAGEQIARGLSRGAPGTLGAAGPLSHSLSDDLFASVAHAVATLPDARRHLREIIKSACFNLHPNAASLLHAVDPAWRPERQPPPCLAGARLAGANWHAVELSKGLIRKADLSHAILREAKLEGVGGFMCNLANADLFGASMDRADLTSAVVTDANLSFVRAEGAIFTKADLRRATVEGALLRGAKLHEAKLEGAKLLRSDLTGADLTGSAIDDADFSAANLELAHLTGLPLRRAVLSGARFVCAHLEKCDLEGVALPGVTFEGARLDGAMLTGTDLHGAKLRNACLREAGMADVNLEGADLSHADLRGVTFHMGSSRSGLLPGALPSEGTRTGFYTDDYNTRHYRPPEEIRVANLCGAKLTGARIEGVDFYLVDVRGATYTADQEAHFRRCGAIVESRVP